ncbi:MAG: hypothetical protein R3E02_11835 [Blastomonas sp.]
MEQYHSIFLIVAIVVIIAMIALWALAGSSAGAANGHSAAGDALDDSAEEIAAVLTEEKGVDGELAEKIAATERELHAAPPASLAPAPEAAQAPVAEPGKPRIAAAVGAPDDLRKIKGVGPKLNALLGEMGVARYDQIAAWTDSDIAEVDQYLGTFKGRIERDGWIEQARLLAADDIAGFEEKFGKL